MTTALLVSQARGEEIRKLIAVAMERMGKGQFDRALALAEAALARLADVEVLFSHDERALDGLIAALTVCAELAAAGGGAQVLLAPRAKELLGRAVAMRLKALQGEEE